MTISNILDYIFHHPCGYQRVFKGWKEPEVVQAIQKAIKENCFAWSETEGKIDGFAMARKIEEEKKLHVRAIIVSNKEALRGIIARYYEMYPDWELVTLRKGKIVSFTQHFKRHLKLLWNLKSTYH